MSEIGFNTGIKNNGYDYKKLNSFMEKVEEEPKTFFNLLTGNVSFCNSANSVANNYTTPGIGEGCAPNLDAPKVSNSVNMYDFSSQKAELNRMIGDLFGGDEFGLESISTISKESQQKIAAILDELYSLELPESTGNVLFDLYEMIGLLLQAGQKLRNAAREIRQAENQVQQKVIQVQAELQKDAARTSMIMSAAFLGFQAIGQIGGFIAQMKSLGKQMVLADQSGLKQARADVKKLTPEVKAGEAKLSEMKHLIELKESGGSKKIASNTAKIKANEAKIASNNESIKNQDALFGKSEKLESSKKVYQNENESLANENNQLKDQNAKLELSKKTDDAKITAAEKAYDKKYGTAEDPHPSSKVNHDSLKEVGVEVDGKKYRLGLSEERKNEITHDQMYSGDMIGLRQKETRGRFWSDMFMSVGNMLQGVARGVSEMKQAEATLEGEEQVRAQEGLDQIKDLFALAQDVIRKVIELYGQIVQVESSSMQEAIRA